MLEQLFARQSEFLETLQAAMSYQLIVDLRVRHQRLEIVEEPRAFDAEWNLFRIEVNCVAQKVDLEVAFGFTLVRTERADKEAGSWLFVLFNVVTMDEFVQLQLG